MNTGIRRKKHSIYTPYTTVFLSVMLFLLCILGIVLSIFFIMHFLIDDYDPTVYLLLAILVGPWVFVLASLWKSGFMQRLFLRIHIEEDGIQCFLLGRKLHKFEWADIRTFGVVGFSFSYVSGVYILFSKDKNEYAPKTLPEINMISHSRMIVQYRSEVWDALIQFMPTDMSKKLSDALSKKQDCFHKR